MSGLTATDVAWFEIENASMILCSATIRAYLFGCGSLAGCAAGDRCDSAALIESQRARIAEARKLVAA